MLKYQPSLSMSLLNAKLSTWIALLPVYGQEIEDVYFGQDALHLLAAGDDDGVVLTEDTHQCFQWCIGAHGGNVGVHDAGDGFVGVVTSVVGDEHVVE